jgi:hypothetical protein
MSDNLANMTEKRIRAGSREFIRGYRRFKEFAARGGRVTIKDRNGDEFIFMRVGRKQHPPRQAQQALDPKAFAGLDLDEPALSPEDWEANR